MKLKKLLTEESTKKIEFTKGVTIEFKPGLVILKSGEKEIWLTPVGARELAKVINDNDQ